jgi:uncharacterized protein (DUF58 family)
MSSAVRLNARIVPLITLLALVMQIVDASRAWMILLIGLGGAWAVCWWWARGLARGLRFEREVRFGWAQVGDRLEERFTLTNPFALPATWVTLYDHSTLPDHFASVATGVDGSSSSQWKINRQCTRRGVYTLGGATLETGDPLGIYTVTLEDSTAATLAVMPPVIPLPAFEIRAGGWSGEGRPNRYAVHETINTSHTREMQPHDPLRLIHWKTTARRGDFYVRQFEGAPAGDWWIVLDLDSRVQAGAGPDSSEEHAVILAASLAARGLNEGHPVGLAINCCSPEWIVPRRNEYQLRALLKALAVASPSEIALQDYLQRAGPAFSQKSSLLLVTANPHSAWIQALLPLMWRGVMPTVFLLDALSFGGSSSPKSMPVTFRSMNVPCHVIPRELLDAQQLRPGREGEWQWRISATGKAVAIHTAEGEWRGLG